jgi:hypothetical protein
MSVAVSTGAGGAFTIEVGGMTAPFLLNITGSSGGKQVTLNSIATAAGQTVNITPLTDLIVSTASGQPGGTALATLCTPVANVVPAACTAALANAATEQKLDAAVAAVVAMIKPINANNVNPLNGAFVANGTGIDALLDQILVAPAEALGAIATITLIATNSALGSVTLPVAAGGAATIPVPAPLAPAELVKANAAASALPEIRACMASLSALYPKVGFAVPSSAAVSPFIDSSFNMGAGIGKTEIVAALTSVDDAGLVTFNYTQTATYGARMDNCGLSLFNGATPVLNAEQNAVGQETSCTFKTSGLNSRSSNVLDASGNALFKFTGPMTNGGVWVTTSELGNQATSGKPYPN